MKPGDRIVLVRMYDDPDPIPVGSEGTVTYVSTVDIGAGPYEQIGVDWDSGRTLQVCSPPDQIRLV